MMRLALIPLLAALSGCGATPVFLGGDDATFVARLTQFHAETAAPGVLRALATDRGVSADGCQISMRGEVPRGVIATLHAGECRADVTDPAEFEREP